MTHHRFVIQATQGTEAFYRSSSRSIWFALLVLLNISALASSSGFAQKDSQQLSQQSSTAALDNPAEVAPTLQELAKSVEAEPDSADARGSYAQALFQVGNIPAAWEQLLVGYQIKPNHTGVLRGLEHLMFSLKHRRLFDVGTPESTLIDVLGEPNKVVDMPWGNRLVYAYMAFDCRDGKIHEVIDLRGASEALFRPTEFLDVQLDGRAWRVGVREKSKQSSSAQYFIPGQSIEDWQEMIQVERFLDAAVLGKMEEITRVAIEQIVSLKKDVERAKHQIIEVTEDSSIVAFEDIGPVGRPKVHQLVRFFRGPVDVHRLTYRVKSEEPPSREVQEKWLRIFQSAALKPVEPSSK